nr:hypothetical protein [Tanacetum cinerariifolium]
MGGSSSQPQSSQPMSPINAFPIEELYMPEFLESLQENTGYWQQPGPYEATTKTSPTKKKKATRNRQKRQVQEIRRPGGRDKAKAAAKNKGFKAPALSTMNDDAFAKLVVNEMTAAEVEQREAFIELKRREVECREREIATTEYRAQQEDMKLYLQSYDHLPRSSDWHGMK